MTPILTGIVASGISGHLTLPWSPEGAYDALATVVVPSGGLSSITFASIPTGYRHLQLVSMANISTADSAVFQFNNDTTASYYGHRTYGDGSSSLVATANSGGSATTQLGMPASAGYPSTTGFFGVSIIDILDYSDPTKNTTLRDLSGWDNNSSGYIQMGSGFWNNASPVTSIKYSAASGLFAQNSQFALYGVK